MRAIDKNNKRMGMYPQMRGGKDLRIVFLGAARAIVLLCTMLLFSSQASALPSYARQTDIRVAHDFVIGKTDAIIGVSINNNPTVQDPFNTLFAWNFPYLSSAVVFGITTAPAATQATTTRCTCFYGWRFSDGRIL